MPLIAVFALGALVGFVIYLVFTRWAFYLGGSSFHIDPEWRGWGRMHSNLSGDYVLYVRLMPYLSNERAITPIVPSTDLSGSAYLCTPRGEIIRLDLYGSMRAHVGRLTDGEAIQLRMSHSPVLTRVFTTDRSPNLSFKGKWQNPDLVLDDEGTFAYAFLRGGSVNRGNYSNHREPHEIVPVTLTPGRYADFRAACPAPHAPDGR